LKTSAQRKLPTKLTDRLAGDFTLQRRMTMADKQIVFTDKDQQEIQAIVIDQNKEEALKFLAKLVQEIKGVEGHACSPGPIR
jgi:hypothetical protein